jgi:hypothetical protein
MSDTRYRVTRWLAATGLCLGFVTGAATAQTRPVVIDAGVQPKTFLFVGNSFYYYNNSMHGYFLNLVKATQPANARDYRATSATISGSGFNWHDMESYLKPGSGMASYSFVGDNEVVFNTFDKPYDMVIMNDCSQCPVHPQLSGMFHEYAKKHSDTIRKYKATPVLFMTWAYADKPQMTAQLAEAYTKAGNANKALVIPAGLAFAKALSKKPDLVMYQKDKRHPSLAGTYLSAATIYSALYKKQAVAGPAVEGLPEETAAFLRSVAWETVQEYYGDSR